MNILFVELVKVFSHFFVLLCEFLIKGVCYWFLSIQAAEIRDKFSYVKYEYQRVRLLVFGITPISS